MIVDLFSDSDISIKSIDIEEKILFSKNKIDKARTVSSLLKVDLSVFFEIGENSIFEFGKILNMPFLSISKGDQKYSAASLLFGSVAYGVVDYQWLYAKESDFIINGNYNFKKIDIDYINFFGHVFSKNLLTELKDVLYWTGLEHSVKNLKKSLDIMNKNGVNVISDCSKLCLNQAESFSRFYFAYKNEEDLELTSFQKEIKEIIRTDSQIGGKYTKHKGGLVKELF